MLILAPMQYGDIGHIQLTNGIERMEDQVRQDLVLHVEVFFCEIT